MAAALAALGLPALPRPAQQADVEGPEATRRGGTGTDGESPTAPDTPADEDPAHGSGRARSGSAPPMAAHFAPLDERSFFYHGNLARRRAWSGGDTPPTAVWGAGPLVPNLIAVLERRLVEASTRGLEDKPLSGATVARLADVATFLSADFDDARCAALLAGLVWARPARLQSVSGRTGPEPVPFAYAALKPLFAADAALRAAGALPAGARLPIPPGLVARLRTGGDSRDGRASDAAVRLALARARASGLPAPFAAARSGSQAAALEGGRMGAGVPADRLVAALLIPVGDRDLSASIKRAYPGDSTDDDHATEDTTHAA